MAPDSAHRTAPPARDNRANIGIWFRNSETPVIMRLHPDMKALNHDICSRLSGLKSMYFLITLNIMGSLGTAIFIGQNFLDAVWMRRM
ncbi:hypothetical protein G3142_005520 [Salmonella enterica subsp. enterica serovar Montevideo]|nr:hypothetical protein [Salmonella enterica subsp. enterica serovar Montevideo]EEK7813589.1 hypothetical protein [Salmonella enterica subsp. enterica serovar Montevideo]